MPKFGELASIRQIYLPPILPAIRYYLILHTFAYDYIRLHTITYYYILLHTITYIYIYIASIKELYESAKIELAGNDVRYKHVFEDFSNIEVMVNGEKVRLHMS